MVPEMWAHGLGFSKLPRAKAPDWMCEGMHCEARVKGRVFEFEHKPSRTANGVTATWVLKDGRIRTQTSRDWQGNRPWSVASEVVEED
jgi:hypothetical protein